MAAIAAKGELDEATASEWMVEVLVQVPSQCDVACDGLGGDP